MSCWGFPFPKIPRDLNSYRNFGSCRNPEILRNIFGWGTLPPRHPGFWLGGQSPPDPPSTEKKPRRQGVTAENLTENLAENPAENLAENLAEHLTKKLSEKSTEKRPVDVGKY